MNNFQIISKLGEGAYSTVYKVKRLIDNNIYALKKVKLLNLSEKEKQNALNEVRILASVKSNFVISYKEAFFDEKDNTLSIVMEYADNGDLYQKIILHKKTAKFFEEIDIWKIFIQLVKGLKSLHDLKILHRDLKSANVFLLSNGYSKLGDLNVSKVARRGLGYTQTGTPYYASPEVWRDKPYDNKSDIWSLGCVLYEMICLHPPFRAQNMEGLYNKVIKGSFNRIPERFSNDLNSIVKLLLQVNAELRPSCDMILKNEIVLKRIEYFKSFGNENCNNNMENAEEIFDENEDPILLKTIRIPKNLLFLSDKLPKPNYDKNLTHSHSTALVGNGKNEKVGYRSFTHNNNNINNNYNKFKVNYSSNNIFNNINNKNNSNNRLSSLEIVKKENKLPPLIKKKNNLMVVKKIYEKEKEDTNNSSIDCDNNNNNNNNNKNYRNNNNNNNTIDSKNSKSINNNNNNNIKKIKYNKINNNIYNTGNNQKRIHLQLINSNSQNYLGYHNNSNNDLTSIQIVGSGSVKKLSPFLNKKSRKIYYNNNNNNNENRKLSDIYKIYAPYYKAPQFKYHMRNDKYNINNINHNYIQNYYYYNDLYKNNNSININKYDNNNNNNKYEYKYIPKRKLSPIHRKIINNKS